MKAVCAALAELIRDSGLSIRAIARYANTPESTIRNILHGRTVDPRLSTVADICRACGTSIERLFSASNMTQEAVFSSPRCAEYDAPAPKSGEKCVEYDAKCAKYDASPPSKNDDSQNVYKNDRIFPDENGDEVLLMCHSLANTGHPFCGDITELQRRVAMEQHAEAEIRSLQERLNRAIAARDKLKEGGK